MMVFAKGGLCMEIKFLGKLVSTTLRIGSTLHAQ